MALQRNPLPPLKWIRVFEAAARLGNFTAAAKELGLTQAAVSQRIRNLELRLGAQLFNRRARGVILSLQGEAWLPQSTSGPCPACA
jgi:LysR family transcriptional regulator, glycine cleavage system transcriptional activator